MCACTCVRARVRVRAVVCIYCVCGVRPMVFFFCKSRRKVYPRGSHLRLASAHLAHARFWGLAVVVRASGRRRRRHSGRRRRRHSGSCGLPVFRGRRLCPEKTGVTSTPPDGEPTARASTNLRAARTRRPASGQPPRPAARPAVPASAPRRAPAPPPPVPARA